MQSRSVRKLVLASLFLALCMILPFLIGQIPAIGKMLSPMHIPVLLCGFICGWQYGLAVGIIAPILRSLLFGMPALFPNAVSMMFELAAYGCSAGILVRILPKKLPWIYVALILSMLLGRGIYGLTMLVLAGLSPSVSFGWSAFVAAAFVNALPGIICHILVIPPLVLAFGKLSR